MGAGERSAYRPGKSVTMTPRMDLRGALFVVAAVLFAIDTVTTTLRVNLLALGLAVLTVALYLSLR